MSINSVIPEDCRMHRDEIVQAAADLIKKKYTAGQIEHGGKLWEQPPGELLDNAVHEVVDLMVYLLTLKGTVPTPRNQYAFDWEFAIKDVLDHMDWISVNKQPISHHTTLSLLRVLLEEVGEVAEALGPPNPNVDYKIDQHGRSQLYNELMQVAAVAVLWMVYERKAP